MIAVGGVPTNPRAGRCQQAQFGPRQIARSNEQNHAALQIEENRQKSPSVTRFPNLWVDGNYFLYMSCPRLAKRKLFLLYCSATIEFSPPESKAQRCIFSTMIPPRTGCATSSSLGIRTKHLPCRQSCAKASLRRRRWIIS